MLRPLFAVRVAARLDAVGFRLIADAWSQCVEKPSLLNLAVLREGMGLYPFDTALLLSSASAYAQWGYASEARTIVERGLRLADDATGRQLLDLQTTLNVVKLHPRAKRRGRRQPEGVLQSAVQETTRC